MKKQFVDCDRSTPMLMPEDMRDWIADDDIVHFIIEAVERVDITSFKVNRRGSGHKQYHPRMMLALLIYCYCNRLFSSRRIERATYNLVPVRFITAGQHPEHNTIARFRRDNHEAFSSCFLEILMLAKELQLLKVGTVSVDGTKIKASANIDNNIQYDRAVELKKQLEVEIADLVKEAESADQQSNSDGNQLPKEISHLSKLKAKMDKACKELEARTKAENDKELKAYKKKMAAYEKNNKRGTKPKKPIKKKPEDRKEQCNIADPDSRQMKHSKRRAFEQSYNSQITVDSDGSQLIIGQSVHQTASDSALLSNGLQHIQSEIRDEVKTILADAGYISIQGIKNVTEAGVEPIVAMRSEASTQTRKHDFRKNIKERKEPKNPDPWLKTMWDKFKDPLVRKRYKKRQSTVETAFGIIKEAMGFRQFSLRGLKNVQTEWTLVSTAYNCKLLFNLMK